MKKIFISAAEPSGDIIAAEVMDFLPNVNFIGIGGDQMAQRGLHSLFPMSDLTVMGFTQVIPKIFSILKKIRQTADYIIKEQPDVILTVDAYSFHSRLVKRLRQKGYQGKIYQYVPPAVWAWKASRAKTMAALYDHVFCIFPFEPKYFEDEGLKATFVGHPAIYRTLPSDSTFRQRYAIEDDATLITILPGSRAQELETLLPIYLEVAKRLKESFPKACFVIPTFPHFQHQIQKALEERGLDAILITTAQDKYACFRESRLAIAASGTVALELASYGVPTLIGYITSPLNYWIAKRLVSIKYICSVNILTDSPVIPEFIQGDCQPDLLVRCAMSLLEQTEVASKMIIQEALLGLQCPEKEKQPQQCVAEWLRNSGEL